MNNSSANNFLLKSVQPSATQSSVAKRNYQDDQAASSQQNFKDVHDSLRAQQERSVKPVAKKAVPAESRKPAHEVEKRPLDAKQARENRQPDGSVKAERRPDVQEHQRNQSPDKNVSKTADVKASLKKAAVDEPSDSDPLTSPTAQPISQTVVPEELGTLSLFSRQTNTDSIDVSDESAPEGTGATDIEAASFTQPPVDADAIAGTLSPNSGTAESAEGFVTGAVATKEDAVVQQISPSPVDATTAPDEDAEIAAAQGAEVLAMTGQAVPAKSAAIQSASSPVTSEDTTESPAAAFASESSTAKSQMPAASSTSTAVVADANAQSPQVEVIDPKAAFEKTLQNLLHPEKSAGDQAVAQAQTIPATASSNPSALDSMLRFTDANPPAARSFVVQTAVPVPMGQQPQWSQAVGEKVLWLAAQNVSSAEINLNPEHLGPMQVKVSVNQDQTTVSFTSHHAVVREVLDQNLGRLREMFSDQGLNLVNVDVSDKSFSRQQGDAKDQHGQAANKELATEEETPVAMSIISQQRLVDHYA